MRPLNEPEFCVDVFQNEYLPEGAPEVSAVLTVTSAADLAQADATGAAEIVIVDCSGSMARRDKITAAREATAAAVDAIGDGVAFAVIAGTHTARVVFPAEGGLAVADPESRDLAKRAVAGLRARGGTRIGEWLGLAQQLFTNHPAGLRHAILLTDGRNGDETLSAPISPQVAHYTGQAELAQAIQEGLRARREVMSRRQPPGSAMP